MQKFSTADKVSLLSYVRLQVGNTETEVFSFRSFFLVFVLCVFCLFFLKILVSIEGNQGIHASGKENIRRPTDLLPKLRQQINPLLLEEPVHRLHSLQVHIRWGRHGGSRRGLHADPLLHLGQGASRRYESRLDAAKSPHTPNRTPTTVTHVSESFFSLY